MTASAAGPGKTAAKLANDFLRFDPITCDRNANYLTDFTPPVGEGQQLGPKIGSCQHEYATKHAQSVTPPLDLRADSVSQYKLAVCCKKCRIHADIFIDYNHAIDPCPNSDHPLHHFTRRPDADFTGAERIQYAWVCSADRCRAQLRVSYRMMRIQLKDRTMLLDTERLQRAYEAMQREEPGREGLRQATPVEVLHRLRRYVKDCLNPDQARRSFPANNKRFGEAFGVYGRDCFEVLNRMGFTYTEAQGDEDAHWHLPNPPFLDDRINAQGSSHREALEDIEIELHALMIKTAAETGAVNPAASESWSLADRDFERTLAAQGYPRYSPPRRQAPPSELLPYFASLGIQPDSADSVVVFAHDRQSRTDPARQSYYFECLQVIAESRQTEDLQTRVAILESQGSISRRDVAAAYRFLDISHNDAQNGDDARILNLFYVRTSDSGPEAKEEARRALRRIGISRQSQRLLHAADQTIESVAEALDWLGNGASLETPDDFLIVFAATKMEENAELTRKAVSIMAQERKSDALNNWLLTGRTDGFHMSTEDALRHIGITETWASIDKSMVLTYCDIARSDKPGDQTEKAIAVLEAAINAESTHSAETWPVGLTSHGNTCYLNSLLQYYYSIKPLRDIILHYEQYQWHIEGRAEKTWRVGGIVPSRKEIEGGQRFAQDLKQLFERMMRSRSDQVRPENDLVCRAFLPLSDYALLSSDVAEVSTDPAVQGNGASPGHVAELAAAGESSTTAPPALERHASNASSVTLLGDTDVQMQNGELPPTPPRSPVKEEVVEPTEAPPLPPRPSADSREHALKKAQDAATSQQDASEVHDNVIYKLRVGLAAQSHDTDELGGEQHDVIRNLTDCGLVQTYVKDGIDGKKVPTPDMWLTLQPPTAPTDIYGLLDSYFDAQNGGTSTDDGDLVSYKSLGNTPPLLQISISRAMFINGVQGKSLHSVKLEDELYLDRYVDHSHPDVLPRRRNCWAWRQQLHALRKERQALSDTPQVIDKPDNLTGPEAITETGLYLKELANADEDLTSQGIDGIEIPADLPLALIGDAHSQIQRLVDIQGQITALELQLADQFQEFRQVKYRLAAAFFHRGNTGAGHYWIYIRDFEKDVWRVYNDETVQEFKNIDEILEAHSWNHGTVSWVAYVQDNRKTEIIQPVCRALEPAPEPEPQPVSTTDVEMQDGDGTINPRDLLTDDATGIQRETVQETTASWDEPRQKIENAVPDFDEYGSDASTIRASSPRPYQWVDIAEGEVIAIELDDVMGL